MARVKKITGYMDQTDFLHELGEARGGTVVYGSVDEVLEHCACAKECGVVKVSVKFEETVMRGECDEQLTLSDIENNTLANVEREKASIKHHRERAEFHRKQMEFRLKLAEKKEQIIGCA